MTEEAASGGGKAKDATKESRGRVSTRVERLDGLVGGHPDTLRDLFERGRPTDPAADLGAAPRGLLLNLEPVRNVYMMARPFARLLAADAFPWRGKTFDHGGNSGVNRIFGKSAFRFHAEVGPSRLDGRPALVLSYAEPAHKNPWPVRDVRDELRTIGPGLAIGPAFLQDKLVLWFGLEAVSS